MLIQFFDDTNESIAVNELGIIPAVNDIVWLFGIKYRVRQREWIFPDSIAIILTRVE